MPSFFRRIVRAPVRYAGLLLAAMVLALAYGIWYAYSVFLVALLDDFGWQRSVIAGGFSTFAVVHGFANPIVGILCDRIRAAGLIVLGGAALTVAMWCNSLIQTPAPVISQFRRTDRVVSGFVRLGPRGRPGPAPLRAPSRPRARYRQCRRRRRYAGRRPAMSVVYRGIRLAHGVSCDRHCLRRFDRAERIVFTRVFAGAAFKACRSAFSAGPRRPAPCSNRNARALDQLTACTQNVVVLVNGRDDFFRQRLFADAARTSGRFSSRPRDQRIDCGVSGERCRVVRASSAKSAAAGCRTTLTANSFSWPVAGS